MIRSNGRKAANRATHVPTFALDKIIRRLFRAFTFTVRASPSPAPGGPCQHRDPPLFIASVSHKWPVKLHGAIHKIRQVLEQAAAQAVLAARGNEVGLPRVTLG